MSEEKNIATRDKILNAAEIIFLEKGKNGTSMQMIATAAGVNKAMLFYYFNSKDLLYKEVLKFKFSQMLGKIAAEMVSAKQPEYKIDGLIQTYFNYFQENPEVPKMIIREILAREEDARAIIRELQSNAPIPMPGTFIDFIQSGIESNTFRDINAKQTLISIIGMSLMYFIGKPFFEEVLEIGNETEERFLKEREASIIDLLKYGVMKRSDHVGDK